MQSFKAGFKFFLFVLLCLVIVPSQSLILLFHKGRTAYVLPRLWHKGVCKIFGIKIRQTGVPYTDTQVLYMSNHISYLDISMMASVIPNASFVAKKAVASWPVWGFLSTLQQTAFISRSRGDAKKEANALDAMLQNGKNLIIFPEGTSTDGRGVLDFKSSLFSIALQDGLDHLMIQPITLQLLQTDGCAPQTQDARDLYAWHRDMDTELHHHLWHIAKHSGALVQITFHDIIAAKDFNDRKTLAKTCHDTVCKGLEVSTKAA